MTGEKGVMMSVMNIKDVCDADHYERVNHYMNQTCPVTAGSAERLYHDHFARKLASQEMVNEIHCMLLHLTKDDRQD